MKTLTILSTATACMALMACSTAAETPVGQAGASSAGTPGNVAGSSTGGSSGADNIGGTTSGGSDTGGTTNIAGSDMGGTAGSGAGAGGDTSTSGGGSGGTGGSGGSAGGAAGGAAGGGTVGPSLVGAWDGALLQYPCGNTGSGYDCAQPAATNCKKYSSNTPVSTIPPANNVASSWTMGGTTGTNYNVTFRLRGIVEVTSYIGGTRAAGNASILTTPRNLFQTGGAAQASNGPSFDYNTYELDVTPPGGGTSAVYFLNSVTNAQNPHANNSPTTHLTFDIDYTATIKVAGGAKVTVKVTDSNCTQVQNCGDTSGNTCAAPRKVALDGSTPPAPTFAQPLVDSNFYGQWIFFDITNVTVAP